MKSFFSIQQNFFGFHMVRIRNTAIHRANCGALGFLMEACTFRAFIRNNKIYLLANRPKFIVYIYFPTISHSVHTRYFSTICNSPVYAGFVNSVIRTFRLAGSAIDTFLCDNNCHFNKIHCKITMNPYFRPLKLLPNGIWRTQRYTR